MTLETAEREIEKLRAKLLDAETTRDKVFKDFCDLRDAISDLCEKAIGRDAISDLCEKANGRHTGCPCCWDAKYEDDS